MICRQYISSSCANLEGSSIIRHYVRGIVIQENKLLMLYSHVNKDYSFPGGGVEPEETNHDALSREMMEECGAKVISIGQPFAEIIEFDPALEPEVDLFIRKGFYFLCRISDQLIEPNFSPSERLRKNTIVWVDIEKALYNNQMLMKKTDPPAPRWTRRETYILSELIKHPELCRGNYID